MIIDVGKRQQNGRFHASGIIEYPKSDRAVGILWPYINAFLFLI